MMYKNTNDMLPSVMHELCKKNNELHTYDTHNKIYLELIVGVRN